MESHAYNIVTFNGNGSDIKNENDVLTSSTISYGENKNQYEYLFSEIKRSIDHVDEYVVLCPLYQQRDKRSRSWEYKFDYQLAVTGKAKNTEPDSIDGCRVETMNRELAEELNIRIDINRVPPLSKFPKFKFGWGVIRPGDAEPYNSEFDFRSCREDYNRRVMVVVLEHKNKINTNHVNNHFYCETDIIGIYRKPLRDIFNELLI
jgi:hypothetical protein